MTKVPTRSMSSSSSVHKGAAKGLPNTRSTLTASASAAPSKSAKKSPIVPSDEDHVLARVNSPARTRSSVREQPTARVNSLARVPSPDREEPPASEKSLARVRSPNRVQSIASHHAIDEDDPPNDDGVESDTSDFMNSLYGLADGVWNDTDFVSVRKQHLSELKNIKNEKDLRKFITSLMYLLSKKESQCNQLISQNNNYLSECINLNSQIDNLKNENNNIHVYANQLQSDKENIENHYYNEIQNKNNEDFGLSNLSLNDPEVSNQLVIISRQFFANNHGVKECERKIAVNEVNQSRCRSILTNNRNQLHTLKVENLALTKLLENLKGAKDLKKQQQIDLNIEKASTREKRANAYYDRMQDVKRVRTQLFSTNEPVVVEQPIIQQEVLNDISNVLAFNSSSPSIISINQVPSRELSRATTPILSSQPPSPRSPARLYLSNPFPISPSHSYHIKTSPSLVVSNSSHSSIGDLANRFSSTVHT